MTETGEKTALPQSTTNDRVSEKICCVYMNLFTNDVKLIMKFHFHRSNSSYSCHGRCYGSVRTILLPGPLLHHQFITNRLEHSTDRLFHHLAPTHILDARITIATDQLPNRVHPTGSETKYHVFNNQITDNVDIYHSEATTLIPKACTMKYTQNIRAHTVTTHIQPQNPEIIYEHLPYCSYQPYSFKCDKYISMVT